MRNTRNMDETYYLIRQRLHPSEQERRNSVFVKVSEGRLERITGDTIIFSLLELKNGKPKMKKKAVCGYDFYPLNKTQCEFQIAIAEGRTCGDEEIRTYRDVSNKVIMIGRRI